MDIADRILWQRSRTIEAVEDEGARYLDMAAFAEGRLDPDERERVAEWLRSRPDAAGDIAAARALASAAAHGSICRKPPWRAPARWSAAARAEPAGFGHRVPRARAGQQTRSRLDRAMEQPRRRAGRGGLARLHARHGYVRHDARRDGPGSDDGVAQDLFGSSPAFFRDLTGGA